MLSFCLPRKAGKSMDVLKNLFEQYFHAQAERMQPVQGQLGVSGRKIIRVANDKFSAIGILYGVREENIAFLMFYRHFWQQDLMVQYIYEMDCALHAYLDTT